MPEADTAGTNRCLGLVLNDQQVLLIDVEGRIKTFTSNSSSIQRMCFSTHGAGVGADLTPCLTEDGKHVDDDNENEDCFCGIEDPHIHAHKHHVDRCRESSGCSSKTRNKEREIGYLASMTLEECDETKRMDLSELHQHHECKESDDYNAATAVLAEIKQADKVYQFVQYESHLLVLVCPDCSATVQTFEFASQRSLGQNVNVRFYTQGNIPENCSENVSLLVSPPENCCEAGTCNMSKDEPLKDKSAPHCVEEKGGCCDSEGTCTKVVDPILGCCDASGRCAKTSQPSTSRCDSSGQWSKAQTSISSGYSDEPSELIVSKGTDVHRSNFFVGKICCASEVPAIRNILEPITGVQKVAINVPNKMVYVDHDLKVLSAHEICDALNKELFDATVTKDAKDSVNATLKTVFVHSTLIIQNTEKVDSEAISKFLELLPKNQIESFAFDPIKQRVLFVHNPLTLPIDQLSQEIENQLNLRTIVEMDGAAKTEWDFPDFVENEEKHLKQEDAKLPRVTVLLSGIFWITSMLSFIGGDWEYLKYVALLSVAFGLPPIAFKAFATLKRRRFDTNVLMLIAALGAVALQEFTEAAAVTFLFAVSEWLELKVSLRVRNALSEIVALRPDRANLIHPTTKEIIVVPAAAVPIGAIVSVKTGDKIPCDGVVLSGKSTVDESSLTGESRPVRKFAGSEVAGGTINSGCGEMLVRTIQTSENSAVSRLIRYVEEAQSNRSETEKLVDSFAKWYTPIVLVSAIFMCTIPWAFGTEIGRQWTNNGLVLIVVACPCALIISTPVTYVAGLAACAQNGILVKGGANLETLGRVKQICFDKTGTLTEGNFALLRLKALETSVVKRKWILEMLGLLEERAHHPMAQAIVAGIENEGVKCSKLKKVENITSLDGEGVTASIDGLSVFAGNKRLFQRLGLYDELPEALKVESEQWASLGETVGFFSIEGQNIVCAFSVADAVRKEAASVVSSLLRMGIEVQMLTGDNSRAAIAIGKQLGLQSAGIRSELTPKDKLEIVQDMQDACASNKKLLGCHGRPMTMFCGDGVNDAPALAISDVGVAMGSGAALAMETSDVTLLDSNLYKLMYSLRMGKRVVRKIFENVIFSFAVKAVVVGFMIHGDVQLWAAIGSDVGGMLLVTLNGMTLLPRKRAVHLEDVNARSCSPSSKA